MTTLRFQGVFTVTAVLMPHVSTTTKILTQTIVVSEVSTKEPHFLYLLCSGKVLSVVDKLKLGDMISANGWVVVDRRTLQPPKSALILEVGSISILHEVK